VDVSRLTPWFGRAVTGGLLAATAIFFARGRWLMALVLAAASLMPVALRLPRGRRAYFAAAAMALSVVATLLFALSIDLYLHHRFARTGGYNVWGYRGPAVGAKQPGERRLVMLGGSVAFGYGVAADETIPSFLQQRLNTPPASAPVTVVNLAWNSEGAYSFLFTLRDYESLQYDGAILYSGYNDMFFNNQVFRHESAVFRLTGYLPILPIIPLRGWLHLEDLSETSRDGRVVFHPGLGDRYATEASETALRVQHALDRQLQRVSPAEPAPQRDSTNWRAQWNYYCTSMQRSIDFALSRGKQVFVVSEPYKNDVQVGQQQVLAEMLARLYRGNPRVRYINMGTSVDLTDRRLCVDGLHLTAEGNARVAAQLASALRPLLESAE
jgi:hypothetical protein